MKSKLIGVLAVTIGIATGGYWYYSPYLAVQATQEAADTGNADDFNKRVDYPKLRESFKGQMGAFVLKSTGQGMSGAESFGAMLGLALVNQMVDAVMRPEMVMNLMQARKLQLGQGGNRPGAQEPGHPPGQTPVPAEKPSKIEWNFERASVDKLIAYGREPGVGADDPQPGFVFERSGFADWKLTEIQLVLE